MGQRAGLCLLKSPQRRKLQCHNHTQHPVFSYHFNVSFLCLGTVQSNCHHLLYEPIWPAGGQQYLLCHIKVKKLPMVDQSHRGSCSATYLATCHRTPATVWEQCRKTSHWHVRDSKRPLESYANLAIESIAVHYLTKST